VEAEIMLALSGLLRAGCCRLYVASLFAPAIIAQRHSTVHEPKECRIH
jgi:hypothetical protein